MDKAITNLVGVFTDPILVWPGGWGDTLPEWIKPAITLERLLEEAKPEPTGTDAEVVAYLYTVSLTQPMDYDWVQIYLYVSGKAMTGHKKETQLPPDILVDKLTQSQEYELKRLKTWLYEHRKKARKELARENPKPDKQAEATLEQMAFKF